MASLMRTEDPSPGDDTSMGLTRPCGEYSPHTAYKHVKEAYKELREDDVITKEEYAKHMLDAAERMKTNLLGMPLRLDAIGSPASAVAGGSKKRKISQGELVYEEGHGDAEGYDALDARARPRECASAPAADDQNLRVGGVATDALPGALPPRKKFGRGRC